MSADLSSLVTAFTESTNAVSAMIASLVTLFGVLRFKRRAPAAIAAAAVVGRSAGAGLGTMVYASNAVPQAAMATPGLPSATIYAPQGTVTKLPRWVTSTHTPLVIIAILLIALFDMRRTPDVEPLPVHVAPVITDASASVYEYDRDGNLVSYRDRYITFNVAGSYDGLGRMTRVSIPTSSNERSDFSWVADFEKVSGVGLDRAVFDLEQPAGLVAARLRLRTGDVSTYSIARVGGDSTPGTNCMVYVYALGLGDDVRNTNTWMKIGEGTLTPSGSWSVVGSVSGDGSMSSTPRLADANISLTAIVVSSDDAAGVSTTLTLGDLDAMGRSKIVTVVPHRGLQWGHGTDGVAGVLSRTTPVTGVPPQR